VVLLSAPTIDSGDLVAPLVGQQLTAAATLVAGTAGAGSDAVRAAWLRREILDPLASRFERQGHPLTFDESFTSWLLGQLPADGSGQASAISDFMDRTVTPALAATLPPTPGPVTATIVDGKPALRRD
jgi:hypothetical protein